MKRRVMGTMIVISSLLSLPASAEGQRARGPGGFAGVSFVAADAVGDLGTVVNEGFGLELSGGLPVAGDGHLRLRGDLGFVIYGHEQIRYCSFGCRVESELTTTNNIIWGGIGPEVVLARGPIQPYVHASAGVSFFVTSSSVDDRDGLGPYLETTNYSDAVFGWKFGGGLRFRVSRGHRPVFIDLGVERHDNGVTNYLTEGDIVDEPDGSITLYPNRSDADLVSFRLGVAIGVR